MADPARGAPEGYQELNRYTQVIVDEALRRGIAVEIVDAPLGELVLTFQGRQLRTIESLSELTNAVAFRHCDDKLLTRRTLTQAGFSMPAGRAATFDERDLVFLAQWGDIVVKPARGEQGWGVTVGVTDPDGLAAGISAASQVWRDVVLEQRCLGEDLRVVVIGEEVVAASVRRPPVVTGDGRTTIAQLIQSLSASRSEATGGAAKIPMDAVTLDVVARSGYSLNNVLPLGEQLVVRRTANVHTGGTIQDVTDDLHPHLASVAVEAARAINVPVTGLDFIVPALDGADYAIIEVNEQPGLANHEPRPTVERFIDLLFPETA